MNSAQDVGDTILLRIFSLEGNGSGDSILTIAIKDDDVDLISAYLKTILDLDSLKKDEKYFVLFENEKDTFAKNNILFPAQFYCELITSTELDDEYIDMLKELIPTQADEV